MSCGVGHSVTQISHWCSCGVGQWLQLGFDPNFHMPQVQTKKEKKQKSKKAKKPKKKERKEKRKRKIT